MEEMMSELNAGDRFWQTQLQQGTGLCVGLDPHYSQTGPFSEVYDDFADLDPDLRLALERIAKTMDFKLLAINNPYLVAGHVAGVTNYILRVVDVAWSEGVRVFKPQAAFFERMGPLGLLSLQHICYKLRRKGECFTILDAKRGDIFTTQDPYYWSYLAPRDWEVIPGMMGSYDFDAMTVTTWMGEDVLTPALPFIGAGRGVIVVTRTSNPSGTTLQDGHLLSNLDVRLSDKQEHFRYCEGDLLRLRGILGRDPMAHEVMLDQTQLFCDEHGLDQEGSLSPISHVMGSTVVFGPEFHRLRPRAVALVPGFGAQGGSFGNVTPLARSEGAQRGIIGALSTSRGMCFAWMEKYGGTGNIADMDACLRQGIATFRKEEKEAYEQAGAHYPF